MSWAGEFEDDFEANFTLKQQTEDGEGNVKSKTFVRAGRPPQDTVHIPEPAFVSRTSTLFDREGNVTQQWVQEKPEDRDRLAVWKLVAEEMAATLPHVEPIPPPVVKPLENLMACYPIGDHHLGMLAWKAEVGASYDLDIGERLLTDAMHHLVTTAPSCEQATIVFLGDFLHYDGMDAVTPTSRNLLDSDGRFPKLVRAAVRTMRRVIEYAARRHNQVRVIVEIGNHDLSSSIWVMECLHNIYENNPRITVDTAPGHYHYFSFGKNLVGTHHGHEAKAAQLPGIMAHDQPELWGQTTHRTWWTGHVHHQKWTDFPGCSVESFRILAPNDAWSYNKGYRAQRAMTAIVLHKEYGQMARHSVNPAMLEGA